MFRQLAEACLPGLIALTVAFMLLWLVARLSGARLCCSRLRRLHGCEAGGVQSLAFVLTLPIFLMILLFIVQVSQLMIGLMTVNYAAYASARSASVWIPAQVGFADQDLPNRLPRGLAPGTPVVLTYDQVQASESTKYREMFLAAAMACAPIAPSRDLAGTDLSLLGGVRSDEAMINVYPLIAPSAAANARLPQRIRNKLAYSLDNTVIEVSYLDKDSERGPTYNPQADPYDYRPHEVGWQDPVTVKVWHQYGLLPGPGRFLANIAFRPDGTPDLVAQRINEDAGMHKVWLSASATMTVEGLQSTRPYLHP